MNPPKSVTLDVNWPEYMARHDLLWDRLPTGYFEGPFVGNGILGTILFADDQSPNTLGFEIGRTDVYDHRPYGFGVPAEVMNGFRGGQETPHCMEIFASCAHNQVRLPIGRLLLTPAAPIQKTELRLDLWNAEIRGSIHTQAGRIDLRCFVPAEQNLIIVEIATSAGERGCALSFRPQQATSPRYLSNPKRDLEIWGSDFEYVPNPPFEVKSVDGIEVVVQPLLAGSDYATAWREVSLGDSHRIACLTVANRAPVTGSESDALETVRAIKREDLASIESSHRAWWHEFYPASFVTVPETRIESFYWIQLYKLASATRENAPVVDLMGPWFKPSVWAAYWHNLNTQLAYYTVHITNHPELGEPLCRLLEENVETLIRNVPPEYRHDSAALGYPVGVHSLVGAAPGPVREELGDGAYHFIALPWLMQHLYLQYRHTMDERRLRESIYPLLRRTYCTYLHVLDRDAAGRYHIPKAYSDEYGVAEDTSMNIALLRWGLITLIDVAERLRIEEPLLPKWREVLERLVDYPVDPETGIMIGKSMPFDKPHRHYSHLFGIFPFYLEAATADPARREMLLRSIARHVELDGDNCMYKFTGSASLYAAMGKGDEALEALRRSLQFVEGDSTVTPNTLYSEIGGWQTFESPISAARSVLDLLIQSWGGVIRIFPACPAAWGDAAFYHLSAEGGFLVSAARKGGITQWVSVKSLAGEPCRIWIDGKVHELELARGAEVILGEGEGTVTPLPMEPEFQNAWGVRVASIRIFERTGLPQGEPDISPTAF